MNQYITCGGYPEFDVGVRNVTVELVMHKVKLTIELSTFLFLVNAMER
jgi:hypothetical protein